MEIETQKVELSRGVYRDSLIFGTKIAQYPIGSSQNDNVVLFSVVCQPTLQRI
jgi:hypothetical protein